MHSQKLKFDYVGEKYFIQPGGFAVQTFEVADSFYNVVYIGAPNKLIVFFTEKDEAEIITLIKRAGGEKSESLFDHPNGGWLCNTITAAKRSKVFQVTKRKMERKLWNDQHRRIGLKYRGLENLQL